MHARVIDGIEKPNLGSALLSTKEDDLKQINPEHLVKDLQLFGDKSKVWFFGQLVMSLSEERQNELEQFAAKLASLKAKVSESSLGNLMEQITSLEQFLQKERDYLFQYSLPHLLSKHAAYFIDMRARTAFRFYATNFLLYSLQNVVAEIHRKYLAHTSNVNAKEAEGMFNNVFNAIGMEFKEGYLNFSKVKSLKNDENESLSKKVIGVLQAAQDIKWRGRYGYAHNARSMLEDCLVEVKKHLEAACHEYFGSDVESFYALWGVNGPFIIIPDTKLVGDWDSPIFNWEWDKPGLTVDRLDSCHMFYKGNSVNNCAAYTYEGGIDSHQVLGQTCLQSVEEALQYLPKSSVYLEDGQAQYGAKQVLIEKQKVFESIAEEVARLSKKPSRDKLSSSHELYQGLLFGPSKPSTALCAIAPTFRN